MVISKRPITDLVEGFLRADPTDPKAIAKFAADAKQTFEEINPDNYEGLTQKAIAETSRLIENIARGVGNQALLEKAQSVVAQPEVGEKAKSTPQLRK